jgi:peptide deformylase
MSDPGAFDLQGWLDGIDGVPPIVQAGASVLRGRAADVPASVTGSKPFLRLLEVMVDVMRAAPGVGLAGPQLGIPWRVYVAEDPEERLANVAPESRAARGRLALPLTVFVNPQLTLSEVGAATFYEGCLSVRGYGALVTRASTVDVAASDAHGRPFQLHLTGWPARIMQHETDHLDGTLYVDRMITRSLAGDEELVRLGSMPVAEVLSELGVPMPDRIRDSRRT